VTSRTNVLWLRADLGITFGTGSGVATWADQGANGYHATAASSTVEPTRSASGGPNSTPYLEGDGTDDVMVVGGWDPPAPGTTPIVVYCICYAVSNATNDVFYCGNASTTLAFNQGGGTNIRTRNSTAANTVAMANGTWFRTLVHFSASTSDYVKVGSTTATGTSTGGNNATNFHLFGCATTGLGFIAGRIAEIGAWTGGDLSGTEKTDLDTYTTGRYGAGLV